MTEPVASPRIDRRRLNAARTRIAILETAMEMAGERSLGDVQVNEIVERAGVSRMTFFNHFGEKDGLWFFYAWTWWLRSAVALARRPVRGLAGIRQIFADVAAAGRGERRFLLEFISFITRVSDLEPLRSETRVTAEERVLLHPDVPDVLVLPILTTVQQFRRHLEEAVADGELPTGISQADLIVDLGAAMYGGILMAHLTRREELLPIFERQLDQVFGVVDQERVGG